MAYGLRREEIPGKGTAYAGPGMRAFVPTGFDNAAASARLKKSTMAEEEAMREDIRGDMDHQEFALKQRSNLAEMADHYQRLAARGATSYFDDDGRERSIQDLGRDIIRTKTFLDDYDSKLKRAQQLRDQAAKFQQEQQMEAIKKPYGETRQGYMEGLRSREAQERTKAGNTGQIKSLQDEYESNLKIIEEYNIGGLDESGQSLINPERAAAAKRRNMEILKRIEELEGGGSPMGGQTSSAMGQTAPIDGVGSPTGLRRKPLMGAGGSFGEPEGAAKTAELTSSKGQQLAKVIDLHNKIRQSGADISKFPAVQRVTDAFFKANPELREQFDQQMGTLGSQADTGYRQATVGEAARDVVGGVGSQFKRFSEEFAKSRTGDEGKRQARREAVKQMASGIAKEFMAGPDTEKAAKVIESYSQSAKLRNERVPGFDEFYNAMKKAGVYSVKAVKDAYDYWVNQEIPYLIKE